MTMPEYGSREEQLRRGRKYPNRAVPIMLATARVCDVSLSDLRSERRTPRLSLARHFSWYVASKLLPAWSTTMIGRYMGGRNHASVSPGLRRVEALIQARDPDAMDKVDRIGSAAAAEFGIEWRSEWSGQ